MKKYLSAILLVGIILLAFFLRFYQLGVIPNGMDSDETSIGYNAYSILQTGKDEYGHVMPLYFTSFGDQKLPVYIYMTTASVAIFGLTPFAVRFPSALLGSLTVVVLYFLLFDLSKKKYFSLLSSLFLAINPWHLFFSRAALEDNVALFFTVLATFFFVRGIYKKQKMLFFSLSIMSFMLSFYSYNVTRLLAPLLLGMLVVLYRKELLHVSKKNFVMPLLIGTCLSMPFLLTIFTKGGVSSAKGALITSSDITARYISWRSYVISMPAIFTKIVFNKLTFLVWQYLQNVVSFLSPSFFFVTGAPAGYPGIGNYGEFYLFEFPTIIAGIIFYFRNKAKFLTLFFYWAVITLLVASLSKTVPHVTRGYFLVLPLSVFSAYGFFLFLQWAFSSWRKFSTKLSVLGVSLTIIYAITFYFTSYYVRFPVAEASSWTSEDSALVTYVKDNQSHYTHIIFDNNTSFRYSAFLFYSAYSPQDFQNTQIRYPRDGEGFTWVKSFGKYEFRSIDWKKDLKTPGILIVTKKDNIPPVVESSVNQIATFMYPTRPIVLSAGEKTYQFPASDNAYVAIVPKK